MGIVLHAVQTQINSSPSPAYDLKGTKSLRGGNGDIASEKMKTMVINRALVTECFLVHFCLLIGVEVKYREWKDYGS